jgi:hypothetical protein
MRGLIFLRRVRVKRVIAGLFLFVALVVGPAIAADDRDFTIVNSTGYPIKFLGVNPPNDNVFNENELSSVLGNGNQFKVKFSGADKGCTWNIKVTWADDNTSSIFRGLDLCKINTVTLKYNKATDEASYTTE